MESAPIYLNTSPSITANPMMQRSIVAFPKRGKCNPYWCSLFPLLCFILCAFLLDLCALIFTCIIPSSRGFYNLDYVYLQIRAAALVLYAGAVVLTAIIFIFYFCNLFNLCDSIFTPYLLNLGTLFAIALTLPISVVMVVAEYALPIEAFDDAVYPNGFFTAGILGLAATLPLIMALCFSRFYEFCIGNYKTQKRRIENAADVASKTDISSIFQPPKSRTHNFYNV